MARSQKGQFVPTPGKGNWLSRLRTRYNAKYFTLHDNNVTQFAEKQSSYTNATTGYLIDDLLAYYYVSAFTNTKPDPIQYL